MHNDIHSIQDPTSLTPTICYVGLPSSDCLRERDDTDLAVRKILLGTRELEELVCVQVGLGWVAHLTVMVSCLLGVPLR